MGVAAAWRRKDGSWVLPLWAPLLLGGFTVVLFLSVFGKLFVPVFWSRFYEPMNFFRGLVATVALMWMLSPLLALLSRASILKPATRWVVVVGGSIVIPVLASVAIVRVSV